MSTDTIPCSACGTQWPRSQRFCGACGARLPGDEPAPVPQERKVVTALFADLAASTAIATKLDAEDLRDIVRPFLTAMAEEIERFGGTIQKYAGDAVIAVFGSPIAHEDDPVRAVRAAWAMQDRARGLADRAQETTGRPLELRIGIVTGEVVAELGREAEGLVTGGPLHVAARLQGVAEPGSVLVDERTVRGSSLVAEYEGLGLQELRDVERRVDVYRLTGFRDSSATHTPLVGRSTERELLKLLVARTLRERTPQLVTIVGPAGIGKSRLSEDLIQDAEEHGDLRVLRGRSLPYDEGLRYWALAEIFKADAGILDSDTPTAIAEKAAHRLDELQVEPSPGAVLRSTIGIEQETDPLAGSDPQVARATIAGAWHDYFEAAAASSPLLVLVEDIHWADDGLLHVLDSLGELHGPAFFLLTARPELAERHPEWGGGLTNRTALTLGPLTREESAEVASAQLGGELPPEALELVLSRAEGNPFFARELVAMLVDEGFLTREEAGDWALAKALPQRLPDTVQGVLAARIDRLDPGEKRTLQIASVVGRTFWRGAVAHVGGADCDSALDRLAAKGLIAEQRQPAFLGERELVFNHVLTRDVAYRSLPRDLRAEAHAGAGRWIEQVTRGREMEFAEILAAHFGEAGESAGTMTYATLAGDRAAQRLFEAEAAERWYSRALAAGERLDVDAAAPAVARALLGRSEALQQLGRFDEAEADARRAIEAATSAGDPELEAEALASLTHVYWLEDRYEEVQEAVGSALDAARAVGDGALVSRLLYTAGASRFGRGEWDEALRLHQEALQAASAVGDRVGEAFARHGLCETYVLRGPVAAALEYGESAKTLLEELGLRPLLYENEYMRGIALAAAGRLMEAGTALETAIEGTRQLGDKRNEAYAVASRGAYYSAAVLEDEAALEEIDTAVTWAESAGIARLELVARIFRATTRLSPAGRDEVADDVAAVEALRSTLPTTFSLGSQQALMGWLAAVDGDRETASRHFAEARAIGERSLLDALFGGRVEIVAWCDTGDAAGAADAASWLRRAGSGQSELYVAWADYAEATAARLEGRTDEARAIATRATEAAAAAGDKRLVRRLRPLLAV